MDGGYHNSLSAKVSSRRTYPEHWGHCLGLARLGETINIDRLDERQRVENDTLYRARHSGLALDAIENRAGMVAAVRENQADQAAEREQPQGGLILAAKVRQAGVGQQV